MEIVKQIKKEAKSFFTNARGSHDWEHTQRVYNLCMHIGQKESADLEILELAALLHDIGRLSQDKSNGRICHAEEGARAARKILGKYGFDKRKIEKIIHCILSHRFRGKCPPRTKEAKVLFDADKLDSIGAVGIARAFLFAGEVGAKLHNENVAIEKTAPYTKEDTAFREYAIKLKKIEGKMLTPEGKKLAQKRHHFMNEFFERLNHEIDGVI
jgi:uncharacterized protein